MPTKSTRTPRSAKAGAPPMPMPAVMLDASARPDVIDVPRRTVLAIDGQGEPGGPAFQAAVGALYGVGYALKFDRKGRKKDFRIGPLEAKWIGDPHVAFPFIDTPRAAWRWQLRLGVPDDVTPQEVHDVVQLATQKAGGKLFGSKTAHEVKLVHLRHEKMGRVLHTGPYADEAKSFDLLYEAMAREGLEPAHEHLEVYLNDPRRVDPEQLKTVLFLESQAHA